MKLLEGLQSIVKIADFLFNDSEIVNGFDTIFFNANRFQVQVFGFLQFALMNLKYKLEAAKITKLARNEPFDVKKWNNKVKTSKEANQIVGLVNMRFRVVMNSFHCKLGILSSIFNVSFQIEEKREISSGLVNQSCVFIFK